MFGMTNVSPIDFGRSTLSMSKFVFGRVNSWLNLFLWGINSHDAERVMCSKSIRILGKIGTVKHN